MKFKLTLALLLATCLVAPLSFTGCKSTPQQVAYQSVATTQVSVDVAMTAWGKYVAAMHPPVEQEILVAKAYQKYQAAMVVVCDAGKIYSAGAQGAASALQTAVQNANQTIVDLENLIATFGVTIK